MYMEHIWRQSTHKVAELNANRDHCQVTSDVLQAFLQSTSEESKISLEIDIEILLNKNLA